MQPADRTASLVWGLGVIAVGLAGSIHSSSSEAKPETLPALGRTAESIARRPLAEYAALRALSAADLDADLARERVRAWRDAMQPRAPMRRWRGVVWEDGREAAGTGAAEILVRHAGDKSAEEGPPFHFLVDADGRFSATSRWIDQRPWRAGGLTPPDEWIIVRSLTSDRARGDIPAALEALAAPDISRGALAVRTGESSPVMLREPRK